MFLYDLRLKFARDLIGHWLNIRGSALVPFDEDLDPRELLRCRDDVAIADLTQPPRVAIELAGSSLVRRFGCDLRRVDWTDLVPPMLDEAGQVALGHMRTIPCGFYYAFTAWRDDAPAVAAETLVLPLRRHRFTDVPDALIAITRDTSGKLLPSGWLTPSSRVEDYFNELVDIGAGV